MINGRTQQWTFGPSRGTRATACMSFAIGFQLGNDYPPRVTVYGSFVTDVSAPLFLVVPRPSIIEFGSRFVDVQRPLRIIVRSVEASLPRHD